MNVMCAAIGCTFQREAGSLFCYRHPDVTSRTITGMERARQPATPVVKAVVKWMRGPIPYYRATHPKYWPGFGFSPGEALRSMRPDDDACPF